MVFNPYYVSVIIIIIIIVNIFVIIIINSNSGTDFIYDHCMIFNYLLMTNFQIISFNDTIGPSILLDIIKILQMTFTPSFTIWKTIITQFGFVISFINFIFLSNYTNLYIFSTLINNNI